MGAAHTKKAGGGGPFEVPRFIGSSRLFFFVRFAALDDHARSCAPPFSPFVLFQFPSSTRASLLCILPLFLCFF